ncbi:MAG: membrane protein of unknown function [Promethearchaeota archaeon]|nr:MAG: membrane protein of unknown function [Candidatus Lokiarchaeota archaeon]
MFCPNCGAKVDEDQSFCTKCGSSLNVSSPPPQTSPQKTNIETIIPSDTKSESKDESIKALVMGVISCILALIGGILIRYWVYPTSYIYAYYYESPGLVKLFIPLTCFIVGVVLGQLARKASNEARAFESENAMEKVGRVFGIIGIVVNAVIMAFYLLDIILRIFLGISLAGVFRGGLRTLYY